MNAIFRRFFLLSLALILLVPAPAKAEDDIGEQIKLGLKLYEQGKINQAVSELEFALAQLRQLKADRAGAFFPDPPKGWTAEKPSSEAVGPAIFGGLTTSSRIYRQNEGNGRAEIRIIFDSPLIQSLGVIFNTTLLSQGALSGRLLKLNGHKARLEEIDNENAELQMLVDGGILVQAEVSGVTQAADMIKTLAGKINFNGLKSLSR